MTTATRHRILQIGRLSLPALEALGPNGFLINVARGTVVDEAALTDALAKRRIDEEAIGPQGLQCGKG